MYPTTNPIQNNNHDHTESYSTRDLISLKCHGVADSV